MKSESTWVRGADNTNTNATLSRNYTRGTEMLAILVYVENPFYGPDDKGRILVATSYKRKPSDWWDKGSIPRELVPELIEMLNEAIRE